MAPVESMFSTSFCAVPAFRREEPASTSGPTSVTIARCAAFSSGELRLQVTAIVLAPLRRASWTAATVNGVRPLRSEEHTSELQSRQYLVCRLLLEKKKKTRQTLTRLQQSTATRRFTE